MPQNDRHRERIVPIEFNVHETFETQPLAERVTLVLISNGHASFLLNNEAVTLTAPCVMLFSFYDSVKLVEQNRLSAKSFSFNPIFINSALTFEAFKKGSFIELEDQHDKNMLNMFLTRNEAYKGYLDLPPQTYLRISEWLSIMGTETHAQSDGYWTCRIRRYLLQSLYLIDDIYMGLYKKSTTKPEKSPVNVVLEYIHINYQNELTLDDFCKLVHLNRTTLNRKFKEQVDRTVMDYLLFYRIKVACETLSHTNLKLSEIAEATGFKTDTYFIKQFTAKMNMSPTDYRNEIKEKKLVMKKG